MIKHKKNTTYYLSFPAVSSSAPESFATGLSPVDTAYYKDGAGAWTSLAITDTASEIGSTGVYEIDLSATEMNHDKVIVKFAVSGMADVAFLFDMETKLVSDLNDVSAADVNAQCDTAISDAALATSAALATVDANVDAILVDTSTTLDGKLNTIDTNVDAILVDTGTTIPAQITGLNDLDAAGIRSAVGLTTANLETLITTVDTVVDAILVDTGTTLDTKINTIDTLVDAIKAKTDSLTFTKANEVDSNVQSINGVTITGDGSATPFDV